tara:strand:- start:1635 stop:2336 length:702 start_codon:yes stop_codon:yes gene_type:complete
MEKIQKQIHYPGWELKYFDRSKNFRNYQLSLIKKYLRGEIAEIGPGNGGNLSGYLNFPKKIDLYEPSKNLFFNLKENFKKNKKINFFNKTFNKSKKKYDAILYLDVLEHIKNDRIEIIKAIKSLKKDGYLIINVPAFSFLYSEFDKNVGHFRRYSKSDFKKVLVGLDFQKVNYVYYDTIGFLLSLLSKIFISNYKKNFEKKINFWNSMIWISKILDLITFRFFGKSLLVIIKK